jgi:hypothetical protein
MKNLRVLEFLLILINAPTKARTIQRDGREGI